MQALFLILICLIGLGGVAYGQTGCLTPAEAESVIKSLPAKRDPAKYKKIKKEITELWEDRAEIGRKISATPDKQATLVPRYNELGRTSFIRICRLLVENGWFAREELGDEGFGAMLSILGNSNDAVSQRSLLPVLVEASKLKLIGQPFIGAMVDSIRVGFGQPQLFGTKARIDGDVVRVYPLLNEKLVDKWRADYGMNPLRQQIFLWERSYSMPVVLTPRRSSVTTAGKESSDQNLLGLSTDEDAPLVVATRLVNLNVRVLLPDTKKDVTVSFTRDDFIVVENGKKQEVTFFSDSSRPFDIVLLMDFSGSTVPKQKLIKKAGQRFADVLRPDDRLAVVAFGNKIKLVSPLTTDRAAVREKIEQIEENGMSPIWESLRYVYQKVIDNSAAGRRTAIVLMTDGLDASPNTSYTDAVELVRRGDATVFPVFLQDDSMYAYAGFVKLGERRLLTLADESGGDVFTVKDLKNLESVYEEIAGTVGRFYSLGFEPEIAPGERGWRDLKVMIKGRPELLVQTRRGYYVE